MAMLKWRRMFRSGATWRNRDMHNSTVGILHQRYDNCHRPKVYAGFSAKLQESGTRCQTTGSWITKGRRMPVREMGMWVVMLTRPDMAFCIVHLASCASAWTDEIYLALLSAARFLYDNSEYGFLKGSLPSYSSTAQKTVAMSPYRNRHLRSALTAWEQDSSPPRRNVSSNPNTSVSGISAVGSW